MQTCSRCIHTVPLCIETYSQFQSIWNNVYIFYSVLKGSTIKCYLWQKFHFQCYICSNLILNHTMKLTPSTDDFYILLPVVSRLLKSVKQPPPFKKTVTTTTSTITTTTNQQQQQQTTITTIPQTGNRAWLCLRANRFDNKYKYLQWVFLYRTSLVFVKSSVRGQEGNVTKHFEE